MKKTILIVLCLPLVILTNCKKDEQANTNQNSSTSSTTNQTGIVVINTNWNSVYVGCNSAYNVTIGLGYNSTDIANDAFFASNQYGASPSSLAKASFTKDDLKIGVYYYKVKKSYNSTRCGTGQGIPADVVKNGSFTIEAGKTTTVDVGSLN